MTKMYEELLSEPTVIKNSLANNATTILAIVRELSKRGITNISTVARGTSDNATICFKYVCEILTGIPVSEFHPSVITMYKSRVSLIDNMTIAISQSGKSIDTLAVLDTSRKAGALTVAITNDPESPLAKIAHYHLDLSAGEEKSVAATKTFIAELVTLYSLAIAMNGQTTEDNLELLPAELEKIFKLQEEINAFAQEIIHINEYIILTRGPMQGVGKEFSLKLAECTYSFGHFYSINDFMHGPLALVSEGTNIFMLAPDGECTENYTEMATRLNLLGANLYTLSDIKQIETMSKVSIKMPKTDYISSTVLYGTACHLLVHALAIAKGLNPDKPRNLKKITITK